MHAAEKTHRRRMGHEDSTFDVLTVTEVVVVRVLVVVVGEVAMVVFRAGVIMVTLSEMI